MEQIVLNANLRYVFAALSMQQRGELLTALCEGGYHGEDEAVFNVCRYVELLQEENEEKKRRMRELSAKGVAARLKKATEAQSAVDRGSLRKVTKEENLNKNILNLFSLEGKNKLTNKTRDKETFVQPVRPSLEEVKAFVAAEGLEVEAETFVNFYESHGWMVGTTPIRNWQATLRLWHGRAVKKRTAETGARVVADKADEAYWHELADRAGKKISRAEEVTNQTSGRTAAAVTGSGESSADIAANGRGEISADIAAGAGYGESVISRVGGREAFSADIADKNSLRRLSCRQNLSPDSGAKLDLTRKPFERFMERVEKYDIKSEDNYE